MAFDSKKILEDVKANHAKLNGCPLHDFEPTPRYPERPSNPLNDFVCRRCGGRIGAIEHIYYQRGVRDGMKKSGG